MATVVFGCITSGLAFLTLAAMLWLGLRRAPMKDGETKVQLEEVEPRANEGNGREGNREADTSTEGTYVMNDDWADDCPVD